MIKLKQITQPESFVDFQTVELDGTQTTLTGVPAIFDQNRNDYLVRLDDLISAERRHITARNDLEPRQIHPLLMVYVKPEYQTQISIKSVRGQPIKEGRLDQKFRLNKMLFYEWKEFEKTDLMKFFSFDEFGAAKAGPVPKTLREDLKVLEAKGLMKIDWAHNQPGKSYRFELTAKGKTAAAAIWNKLPGEAKNIISSIKNELFLISAEELKHLTHQRYPEYRKVYAELDID